MSGQTQIWKAMKQESQSRRAQLREHGMQSLQQAKIPFTTHNNGAHLIVEGPNGLIDYWPGTGKWNVRNGGKGLQYGLKRLMKYILGPRIEEQARSNQRCLGCGALIAARLDHGHRCGFCGA